MDIIHYLLSFIQYQHQQICWLLIFICRYIPLKQWAFDDSHSPKYQKFKVDELPVIKTFIKQDWQFLLEYYQWKYHKLLLTQFFITHLTLPIVRSISTPFLIFSYRERVSLDYIANIIPLP